MRLILLLLVLFLTGCGGAPLDYETAMNLLRERTSETVRTSFSASPRFDNQDPMVTKAYRKLMDGHIVVCKTSGTVVTLCEPGPAGDALTQNGATDMSLTAGRWVPASIVAIRRTSRASASADVRMSFEPSPLFEEFEEAFELLQAPVAAVALGSRKQGKMVRVTFQRDDDGWHVENVE